MPSTHTRTDGVIRMIQGERLTPFSLAEKLGAMILFESSTFRRGRSRYSLLVLDEAFRLIQRGGDVLFREAGGTERPFDFAPVRDILDAAAHFAGQHPVLHQDFPHPCGGFGYVGYEFAARCDGIAPAPKHDDIGVDDAVFLFGHVHLVYDHHADVIYLRGINYNEHEIELNGALDAVERRIRDLDSGHPAEPARGGAAAAVPDPDGDRDFVEGVKAAVRDIGAGSLVQCFLSRRLAVDTAQPSLESYRRLRSADPSPYMFHIDFGTFQVFGASPEAHVRLKEGRLAANPLTGSRPRSPDPETNALREREFLADDGEAAGHMLMVDLARNDLGRAARTGSVRVPDLMTTEPSSRIMRIASRVEADLADGVSGLDAFRLSLPAGSVSGVPKIRAMETLDRLERRPRRFHSGVVCFIEPGGDFDACVAVHCCLQKGGRLWLRAGARIVHDSDPAGKFAETGHGLKSMLASLGLGGK